MKKRYASNPYSMATMHTMTHYIEDTERLLLNKLDSMCQRSDQYCDLGNTLHYYAFDVLGEIAFSRKFGFLEAGEDLEKAIKTIDDMQWYDGIIGQIPEWDFVFRRNPLWKYVPSLDTSQFLITRMALEEIDKRNSIGSKEIERKDLLSQLFAAHEKAPEAFKQGDVFAVAHGAIFAGSDSTASTMQSFSWHVLRDPAIYAKLKKELDDATASGKLSEMPQWSEVQALPYFQACLNEAMRLRPAVGLNITRLVPKEGSEIDGHQLPGGTRLALNGWVLHRDQQIFGQDADLYRPERWIEGDAKTMNRYMFQVSSARAVQCDLILTTIPVWWRRPSLYRQEPGFARDEQDAALAVPRIQLRTHQTERGAEVPFDLLCGSRRSRGPGLEARKGLAMKDMCEHSWRTSSTFSPLTASSPGT